jgi:hypothetical protein
MISAPRPKSKIEAMCEHQLASESVWLRCIYIGPSESNNTFLAVN